MIQNLGIATRPLVFIFPKMSWYLKIFKFKEWSKDKINKLMSLPKDDKKLLKKYQAIWTKIEDFFKKLNKTIYHSTMRDI